MQINNETSLYHVSLELARLLKDKGYRVCYPNDPVCNSFYKGELTDMTPYYEFPTEEERYLKIDRCFAPSIALASEWVLLNFGYNVYCRQSIAAPDGNICYYFIIEKDSKKVYEHDLIYTERAAAEAEGISYVLKNLV
jgi:hypothetical protein